MATIRGFSDDEEVARDLVVEYRESSVYLRIHPPGNSESGQEIVVPAIPLLDALAAGQGHIEGKSPIRGTPKVCLIERRPEGLRIQIHPFSGAGSWWVVVNATKFEEALA